LFILRFSSVPPFTYILSSSIFKIIHLHLQRDLTEPCPLDGRDGILGVDGLELQQKVADLKEVRK
jgi:hypothetical protein